MNFYDWLFVSIALPYLRIYSLPTHPPTKISIYLPTYLPTYLLTRHISLLHYIENER